MPHGAATRDDEVPVAWKPGDVILGLYEVLEIFTGGARGLVYRVRHRGWGIDLAVKSPRPEYFLTEQDKNDFEEEAKTWINLSLHPHTVTCYYVRRLGGVPRVFAEYVSGGSLERWIQTRKLYRGGADKALERILDVAIQAAWGLQQAHEHGLIHRDVKPGNILLSAEGVAKVTDFGMAKACGAGGAAARPDAEASALVSAGGMTPAFCSPEQFEGQRVSRTTDIWSWAVSVLAMFTGGVTWSAGYLAAGVLQNYVKGERALDPDVPVLPASLGALLRHCFQRQPAARPADMLEIVANLQQVYEQITHAPYPRVAPRPSKALADTLNNRAVSLQDLNKPEEAGALWEQALATGPHHPLVTYNLGLSRWRTGRTTGAALVQSLQEVCDTHPDDWLPVYLLAQVYLEEGNGPAAVQSLQTITGAGGSLEEVRSLLAAAHERVTNTRRALRNCAGHTDWVSSLSVSPDGCQGLSGSADRTLKYWNLSTAQCVRTLQGHEDWVTAVSLSRDGQTALSGSADKTLKVWDVSAGRCLRTLHGHTNWVLAASLSADKQFALSGGGDGRLKLWELAAGTCLSEFCGHEGPVLCLAWDCERRHVVSGGRDKTLKLWDLASGACLHTFSGHKDKVHAAALSADYRYAVSGSGDRTIKVWDLDTGSCVRTLKGHADGVHAVSVSADGRYILSGSGDRTLKLWRWSDGACLCTLEGHTGAVATVTFTADGRFALSGSGDNTLRLWHVPREWLAPYLVSRVLSTDSALAAWTGFERALTQSQDALAHGDPVRAAQWVREARALTGHGDRPEALEQWHKLYVCLPRTTLRGGWEGKTFAEHLDAVTTVSLNRAGSHAVSGSADGTLKLWEVSTGRCLMTFAGHQAEVTSACLRADGEYLVSGSADRTLKYWRVSSGRCLGTYQGHIDVVSSVSLSADGRHALSGSTDRTLRLWNLRTGACLRTLDGHTDPVHSVSLGGDVRYALSGGGQFLIRNQNERLFTTGQLKLWDVAAGRCLPTFREHADAITAVALSFTGRYALTGGGVSVLHTGRFEQSGPMHLWETATGQCLCRFAGHAGVVTSICLSVDERFALSGGTDRTLKLWETAGGRCLRTFTGHQDAVTALALSADGRFALSGSADRTVKVWTLDWELQDKAPADWDERAHAYLETFLSAHTPLEIDPLETRRRTVKEIMQSPLSSLFKSSPDEEKATGAPTHRGRPRCTEKDFQELLHLLGCAGYGWLRPEGIRSKLKQMARGS